MSRVLVLSGEAGRYDDPWHPFTETSQAVAAIVRDLGHEVEVRPVDEPGVLPRGGPGDAGHDVDLVVVNTGGGVQPPTPDPAWAAAFDRFGAWVDDGGAVLGLHTAANTFGDWPRWDGVLGGAWVRGTSEHPRLSIAGVQGHPDAAGHPVLKGLPDAGVVLPELAGTALVTVVDERYSSLRPVPGVQPLLHHLLGTGHELMGWAHGRRVVYDGLGHDARSYASASRRRLLENEVSWLLDPTGACPAAPAGGPPC